MNYNPFSLEYKRILITGAGGGIGRSIAIEAAKMGAILLLVDINIDALNETVGMLESEKCSVYQINLANYSCEWIIFFIKECYYGLFKKLCSRICSEGDSL